MNRAARLLACILAICIGQQAAARTIFVDSSRNSPGNGTLARPYQAIRQAIQVVTAGDVIRIRGGNGTEPLLYNEEGLVVAVPQVRITNWTTDVHRPAVMGSLDLNPNVNPPSPQLDIISITARDVTVANLILGNAWYCGVAVRHGPQDRLPPAQMIRNVRISNCQTMFTGSSGIFAKNTRNLVVENCEVIRAVQRFAQECLTVWNCYGFEIANNTVRDRPTPPGVAGGEGIDCKDGARNGVVRNNSVIGIHRMSLYIDGFELGCSNIKVINNFVSSGGSGLSIASERGGLVRNIDLHGNIVVNCSAGAFFGPHQEGYSHPVRNIRLRYNTFIANNGYGINVANKDIRLLKIQHNMIVANAGSPIRIRSDVNPSFVAATNNVLKSGHGFDDGNLPLDDDSNQLYVQRFGFSSNAWTDPASYRPEPNSLGVDAAPNLAIGDRVLNAEGRWIRVDIAGDQRKSPGYLVPGRKQDVGARELH